MPRISDEILQMSFFVYPSLVGAKNRKIFWWKWVSRIRQVPGTSRIRLSLRGHKCSRYRGLPANVVLRLNTKNKGICFETTAQSDWRKHPTQDIAVLLLKLNWEVFEYVTFPIEWFMTAKRMEYVNLGIGDDTFMVGRFIGHEGKQKNLPTVRFGNISMMPEEPIKFPKRPPAKMFLVECRSISGYSGSPVFAFINPTLPRPPRLMIPVDPTFNTMDHGPWLLGIDCGHIATPMPMTLKKAKGIELQGHAEFNSAMAAVAPAWEIAGLLDSPEFVARRKKEIEEFTKKVEAGLFKGDEK